MIKNTIALQREVLYNMHKIVSKVEKLKGEKYGKENTVCRHFGSDDCYADPVYGIGC